MEFDKDLAARQEARAAAKAAKEAQHILVFSNNPGPLFLIGTIGTGFFGMPQYG